MKIDISTGTFYYKYNLQLTLVHNSDNKLFVNAPTRIDGIGTCEKIIIDGRHIWHMSCSELEAYFEDTTILDRIHDELLKDKINQNKLTLYT